MELASVPCQRGIMRTSENEFEDLSQHAFTDSALFERTFDEGMALVEETARYLTAPGANRRANCRAAPRCSMPGKACGSPPA